MKKQYYLLYLLSILSLYSCGDLNVRKASEEAMATELKAMPAVDTTTFKNLFVVNEAVSKEKKLPVTRWAIEYPDGLEVQFPDNRRDYIVLNQRVGEEITEALSISHTPRLRLQTEGKVKGFLEEIAYDMQRNTPSFKLETIEKKKLNGKVMWTLQASANFSDFKTQGYNGTYRIMIVVPMPEKNRIIYAVSAMLLANENSGIMSFEDFADKGIMSKIWSSFRYVE